MHFFAFFSHIYIIIISTTFSVPAQWSQWSKHTWFWSSRVRTPPGARLDKLQILEKFQIQTNFRFRQILDKKIGYLTIDYFYFLVLRFRDSAINQSNNLLTTNICMYKQAKSKQLLLQYTSCTSKQFLKKRNHIITQLLSYQLHTYLCTYMYILPLLLIL